MTHIPTPSELRAVNRQRQQEATQRTSRERAQQVIETIAAALASEGVPYGGMRYEVPSSIQRDYDAIDSIVCQLRGVGWKVIENPDDWDDIGHNRPPTSTLLIRFPDPA